MTKSPIFRVTSSFFTDEDGAVTVDWVMLTAGIVLLGIVVVSTISPSLEHAATDIASSISSANNTLP